ncbi:hypothetical protein Tdes44962_MAKER06602 [Teratosphaeria destructans]|uniref:Luciferase domain-containing protein n=1 Tax=Teratosphaeria destructans TaxID=418781 RepID=A0A9W7T1C9_9PEZI|nr:hypothetical protein Tdes44962_MAKER06602 [Teratosphaeria destructans]
MAYPSSTLPHLSGTTLEVCAVFTALAFILTLMLWLWSDWLAFLSLGPGGTPATILGFLRVELLSLFALHDPYNPGPTPTRFMGKPGYLVTQKASPEIFERLRAGIEEMGRSEQGLEIGTSCFEKHGTGLFSVVPAKRTCGGEIVHAHPSDGSMHMTLHPADAKEVLAAGWGERHPIARGGLFERFVPGNFVMIYAPRSEEEVQVALKIVRAGVWFVSGGDGLTDPGDGAERRDSGYVSEVETGEQPACGGK